MNAEMLNLIATFLVEICERRHTLSAYFCQVRVRQTNLRLGLEDRECGMGGGRWEIGDGRWEMAVTLSGCCGEFEGTWN